jgi:hypothetical protein
MWPLVLAIAVVFTGADDPGTICPGLEMIHLRPQCISDRYLLSSNDRNACPQKDTWEPESKVCNMCGGYTDYVGEYELILHDTDLHVLVRMGTVLQRYMKIILVVVAVVVVLPNEEDQYN